MSLVMTQYRLKIRTYHLPLRQAVALHVEPQSRLIKQLYLQLTMIFIEDLTGSPIPLSAIHLYSPESNLIHDFTSTYETFHKKV